ncbi:MAG: HAMP domain-containing sensor histidine kinase [Gemmataceae bacterium]
MRFTIRYQLLLPLGLLILGIVASSAWTAWSSATRAADEIEGHMDAVAATVRKVTFPRNTQTLELMKSLSGADFLLCDKRLEPLRDFQGRPIMTLTALPDDLTAARDAPGLGAPVVVHGASYFCRAVPLGAEPSAGIVLVQFYPEAVYRDAVWQAIRPALTLGAVGAIVAVVLTLVVTQRLSRRIQQLERRTALIAKGDFSPMPLPHRNDELRDLAGSVNDMAQQLAQYQETMRITERLRLLGQVSGGLAHQLRNGVAGARLAVQLHARECGAKSDGEALDVALRQLALVEMHLKRFLDLGRADEMKRAPCDVVALVQETMTLLGPKCAHAHIDLRWRGRAAPVARVIDGDAEHLRHLFLNILTNAVEAAGTGGSVEVAAERGPNDGVAVEIADSGPGPDAAVASRLFEPFVTGKPEGVGLGLAVARQIAQAHGGSITWRRDEGRTTFRIELPRCGVRAEERGAAIDARASTLLRSDR